MKYNLRKLFLATLIIACACSLALYLTASLRQRLAIQTELKTLGIDSVGFSGDNTVASIWAIRPIQAAFSEKFKKLQTADLKGSNYSAQSLAVLVKLAEVKFLILSASDVSDADVAILKDVQGLKFLWLTNSNVTDACIDSLAQIPSLERIKLDGTNITSEGIGRLRSMKPMLKID